MPRIIVAFFLACAATLTHFPTLRAQETATGLNEWASVRAVPPGDEVVVRLKGGKSITGRVQGVSEDWLTLTRKARVTEVSRLEVGRVERVVPKSAARPALIGAATGAAIAAGGAGIAIAADEAGGDAGEAAAAAFGLALAGAGVGALIGLGFGSRQKRVLIYVSR